MGSVGLSGLGAGWTVPVYAALLLSHAWLNHMGIRWVAWLNDFSAWYHIGVVFFILAVAAAEVGVGLALVLLVYRNRRSIGLDDLSEMKG